MFVWAWMSPVTAALVLGALVLCFLWRQTTRRPPGLPPGPGPALPILGHLHLLEKDPRVKFAEWRRRYGDVFSLYMGSQVVIVLNGFSAIKEAFVKNADVFSDRPTISILDKIKSRDGIVVSSGPVWKEQRKTSLEILREMGLGKNTLAQKVQEEITFYIRAIQEQQGAPVDLSRMTTMSVSNNICSILFGRRFEYEDPTFHKYCTATEEVMEDFGSTGALMVFPILYWLPGDLFHAKRFITNIRFLEDSFLLPQVELHKANSQQEEHVDFIHAYLREMKKAGASGKETSLDELRLLKCTLDLFAAGTDTTSNTISFALIYLLHHPHLQDTLFSEISDVIGTGRAPCMADRPEMTLMEAFIMEVQRSSPVAPLGVQHASTREAQLQGYSIPKGAIVMPNLDSVLKDPQIWSDPEEFRPERFIDADGKAVRPEEHIPFGIGRRVCLGESLARMELFLYMTNLVQRFRFLPEEPGVLPSLEQIAGVSYRPKPYKIMAVLRD